MADYRFKVELYQVNCSEDSVGEGAIMLLVKHDHMAIATDPGTVAKAVLIDSGYASQSVKRLKETLDRIQSIYGHPIKFDAVSLSHWDKDHYRGFVAFMQDEQITKWTDGTCSWFHYDKNNNNAPLTHLYCQQWDTKINDFFKKGPKPSSQDDSVPLSFCIRGQWFDNVCIGHFTTEKVLGTNLFTHTGLHSSPSSPSPSSIKNVVLLTQNNNPSISPGDPEFKDTPGLYVIGVNNQILGEDPITVINTGVSRIAALNAKSILLLLVWNESTPVVSLYSGGDAEFDQEERVAKWLSGTKVSVVKAGHHGSRIGTSTNFISKVEAEYYLISAGLPEVIWYFDAWFSCRLQGSGSANDKRIWSVCFPYYLGLVKDVDPKTKQEIIEYMETKYMKPERFRENPSDQGLKDFETALLNLYPADQVRDESTPLHELREDIAEESAYEQIQILTAKIRNFWDKWSAVPHNYYPFGSSTLELFQNAQSKCIESVHVTFESEDVQMELITSPTPPKFTIGTNSVLKAKASRPRNKKSALERDVGVKLKRQRRFDGSRVVVPRNGEVVWPKDATDCFVIAQETADEDDEVPVGEEESFKQTFDVEDQKKQTDGFPWNFQGIWPYLPPDQQTEGSLYMTAKSNDDFFLRQLKTQVLILTHFVNLTGSDTLWSAVVDPTDELADWWFSQFPDAGVSSFTLNGKGKSIEAFSITIQPFQGFIKVPELVYTSKNDVLGRAFDISKDILSEVVDTKGFAIKTCEIILALDPNQSKNTDVTITLQSLYNFVELTLPDWLSKLKVASTNPLKLQTQASSEPGAVEVINALWFMPAYNYTTIWRLHAVEDKGAGSDLESQLFKLLPNCVVDSPTFICTKRTESRTVVGTSKNAAEQIFVNGCITIQASIQFLEDGSAKQKAIDKTKGYWDTYMALETSSVSLLLRWNGKEDPLLNFLTWIEDRISVKSGFDPFKNLLVSSGATTRLELRQVYFKIDFLSNGSPAFNSFAMEFEADLSWGVPPSEDKSQRVPFILSFSWERLSPNQTPLIRFNGSLWPQPLSSEAAALDRLSTDHPVVPPLIPTVEKRRSKFSILGLPGIDKISDAMSKIPPWLPTDFSTLNLEITTAGISFSATMKCSTQTHGDMPTFPLTQVSLDASWNFQAESPPLIGFSVIATLPPNNDIKRSSTDEYTNPALLTPTRFTCSMIFDGGVWILTAGAEDLNGTHLYSLFPQNGDHDTVTRLIEAIDIPRFSLSYIYETGVGKSFTADGLIRFGDVLDLALTFNYNPSNPVPWDFYATLSADSIGISQELEDILPDFVNGFGFHVAANSKMTLHCFDGGQDTMVFSIIADAAEFEFSFVQILKKGATTPPKRMLRFTVGALPGVDSIPLVNQFKQPFDLKLLNGNVYPNDPLPYIEPATSSKSPAVSDDKDPVVLTSGCHFLEKPKKKQEQKPRPPASSAVVSAPYRATFGPLSVVSLGQVSGILNGFALSVPVNKIQKFDPLDLSVWVQGIGLAFDKPPLSMSGTLQKLDDDSWAGGISIDYEPYTFLAGGLYQHVPIPGTKPVQEFETVFVFARLDGPLVELELATISGITGGFGYNSAMTVPDINNVTQFPFLEDNLDSSPLVVLEGFLNPVPTIWFAPADGDIWLAAGLTCSAFQVLSIQAVATLAFHPDITLGIFANCDAKVPLTASPDDEELFVLVEMGLVSVLDHSKGIFHSEGQLTPRSFILDRSCHLSGGFALCYWFEDSGHDGDWVFTIGGYHSAFAPPPHYPVPERLAISWTFDPMVSISGSAYFAITPKVCMGGGSLEITFHAGLLDAYFDAWADFLVNFRPFSFQGEVGVSIGIDFSIPLFFFTIYFHIHFGADLHLTGPPLAGYVFVDWDIISFTIHFGHSDSKNDPLSWECMWQLLNQVGSAAANTIGRQPHVFASTGGLTSTKSVPLKVTAEAVDHWAVIGGVFGFTLKSLFPITTFSYKHPSGLLLSCTFDGPPTFVKPMHVTKDQAVTSELYVEIVSTKGEYVFFPPKPIVELVPMALWGPYDPDHDPNTGQSASDLLTASDSTVAQLMGIGFDTPLPTLAPDTMLPFQVFNACSFSVFKPDEAPKVPISEHPTFTDSWTPDPTGDAKSDWQKPTKKGTDILSAWTSILDGGKKDGGPAAKQYSNVKTDVPTTVFGRWSECFPVPPRLSKGSGVS
ncbi:hypothetical protein PVAR5_8815 [Paecilomyces variotii No. 5]|uniref:DUF6603 domain-containing protein n=1 Tax=Byssochlamys spectabilis (strain No. 5 / NBRC 109023) TaxID=1356009 RepID=V5FPU5_BYSSN|nr:hypothetical protein PVAR5_8815 [Paecilomyces variotii No. 5]